MYRRNKSRGMGRWFIYLRLLFIINLFCNVATQYSRFLYTISVVSVVIQNKKKKLRNYDLAKHFKYDADLGHLAYMNEMHVDLSS